MIRNCNRIYLYFQDAKGQMAVSRCYYCHHRFQSLTTTITHLVAAHPAEELSVLIRIQLKYKAYHYNILAGSLEGKHFQVNEETFQVLYGHGSYCATPDPKCKKMSASPKKVTNTAKRLFERDEEQTEAVDKSTNTEMSATISIGDIQSDIQQPVLEMIELLPFVTSILKDSGTLEQWVEFFRLVRNGKFPLDNIALQLFLDVVKWHSCDTVYAMRYSSNVKRFWAVGYKLFKEKFIRFMGGFKLLGQLTGGDEMRGSLDPCNSRVNFVTPSVRYLRDDVLKQDISCENPGILTANIKKFSSEKLNKSYKVCIDGKKISSGFGRTLGDVDLFGHEESPSLTERKVRNREELSIIQQAEAILEALQMRDIETVECIPQSKITPLLFVFKTTTTLFSKRVQELRLLKIKKLAALEHFKRSVGEKWRESKLAYAISSIKTNLHSIGECMSELIFTIDQLGQACAFLNGCGDLYCTDSVLELTHQRNYMCLLDSGNAATSAQGLPIHSRYVKQRSDTWFNLRQRAKVTGSSLYKALGLDTLKQQRKHFERVINKSEPKPADPKLQHILQYGTDNEINAVATLVGKVLPSMYPDVSYYEDGCHVLCNGSEDPFMVVSPDGFGATHMDGPSCMGFEFKCPIPGKQFTPDVHYSIPRYYIPQLMAEMKALGSEELVYLCYTPTTSTVFVVKFDAELWELMWSTVTSIYGSSSATKPKRKSPVTVVLQERLSAFQQKNVRFVCEIPSLKAIPCSHNVPEDTHVFVGCHGTKARHHSKMQLSLFSMQQTLYKAKTALVAAYNLCRLPAKEVLVVLLKDLDRVKTDDVPHAIPIAYGLSGYGLKVDNIRSLLIEIVKSCKQQDIHVPVLSFDGQFYRIAVRDQSGLPLTILQLQKDVWAEAKKLPKAVQVKMLMDANHPGKFSDFKNLSKVMDIEFKARRDNGVTTFTSPIFVGRQKKAEHDVFLTPPNLCSWLLKSGKNSCDVTKTEEDDEAVESDFITKYLPPDVLDKLHDDLLTKLQKLGVDIANSNKIPNTTEHDMELDTLYTEGESSAFDSNVHVVGTVTDTHDVDDALITANDFDVMLQALRDDPHLNKAGKWSDITGARIGELMSSAQKINGSFTLAELKTCLKCVSPKLKTRSVAHNLSMPKYAICNLFAKHVGDCSEIQSSRRRSVPPLRLIIKDVINRKFSKMATNIVIATHMFFTSALPLWRSQTPFKDGMTVGENLEAINWFSKPEYLEDVEDYIFVVLDSHHLFVNARSTVCAHDIPRCGLSKQAWVEVAKESAKNQSGLSLAMVDDLIDRQSNAFAKRTFCENVENEMRQNGRFTEAEFCRLIRNWYRAEDEAGIPAEVRCQLRMDMRKWLLSKLNVGIFPPPGSHVNGLPIVMFEGILTSIERRTQLYSVVRGGSYNARAIGSLDCETFFGAFQDLDPKGSGVLMPDDIPRVIEIASYVSHAHLDDSRYHVRWHKYCKCINVCEGFIWQFLRPH